MPAFIIHAPCSSRVDTSATDSPVRRATSTRAKVGAAIASDNAAPSAVPTCRNVLLSAEPIASCVGFKNAVAELDSVEMLSPTPVPVTNIQGK